tara:strand:+ start:65 stop:193 length:129 start_codon:yes stop_codon:yes gene_type:complete
MIPLEEFHELDIHLKLTIIYELLVCELIPSLHGDEWRGGEEE